MVRFALVLQMCMFAPILLLAPVMAPWLVRFVTGGSHVEATRLVVPLTITGFMWPFSGLIHKPLEILCLTRRMLLAMLVAFGAGVAANSVLTPRLGATGTAWASVLSATTYVLAVVALTPWASIRADRSRGGVAAS
jgi:O-antigen/teichoic acid export membrane protein